MQTNTQIDQNAKSFKLDKLPLKYMNLKT